MLWLSVLENVSLVSDNQFDSPVFSMKEYPTPLDQDFEGIGIIRRQEISFHEISSPQTNLRSKESGSIIWTIKFEWTRTDCKISFYSLLYYDVISPIHTKYIWTPELQIRLIFPFITKRITKKTGCIYLRIIGYISQWKMFFNPLSSFLYYFFTFILYTLFLLNFFLTSSAILFIYFMFISLLFKNLSEYQFSHSSLRFHNIRIQLSFLVVDFIELTFKYIQLNEHTKVYKTNVYKGNT